MKKLSVWRPASLRHGNIGDEFTPVPGKLNDWEPEASMTKPVISFLVSRSMPILDQEDNIGIKVFGTNMMDSLPDPKTDDLILRVGRIKVRKAWVTVYMRPKGPGLFVRAVRGSNSDKRVPAMEYDRKRPGQLIPGAKKQPYHTQSHITAMVLMPIGELAQLVASGGSNWFVVVLMPIGELARHVASGGPIWPDIKYDQGGD